MLPVDSILEQARKARDARFDGRFFIAVKTTGIYCRPVCPVKMPRAENVTFYASAAAASEAGFRPCLRCRPESSPGTPAWMGTTTTVSRALKLINEGALDDDNMTTLCDRLGVSPRHLNRLFTKHIGASPKTVAQTRRLHFAKRLIDETTLSLTDIAMAAGYGSVRRFNDHFQQTYQRAPGSIRKEPRGDRPIKNGDVLTMRLHYREPYDFPGLLAFFSLRSVPGVESVTDTFYERLLHEDGETGTVRVSNETGAGCLKVEVESVGVKKLLSIVSRVRRMFDTDAIPSEINRVLSADEKFAPLIKANPGQRLPGAWDGFETAVRAIVGQQVSVKGATTVMGTIARLYGIQVGDRFVFPPAEKLALLDPAALPMPGKRAEAIKALALGVVNSEIDFSIHQDAGQFREKLMTIKGIGPWTAQYVTMRALADPDVLLHGDLVIRKVAQQLFHLETEKTLIAQAEQWRPWRAYAGMHLWRAASATK